MNRYLLILTLLSLISASDLEWKAEFRYRLETDKSDSLFNSRANTINYTRSRISLKFVNGPITAFAQLQDSRVLGQSDNRAGLTNPTHQQIEFHQIYFQVSHLLKRNWTMRFGRFEMPLGSERLFSKNNWNNYGRAFEGIHSINQNKLGSLNTFYLINEDNSESSNSDVDDQVIQGIYISPATKRIPFLKGLNFYAYNENLNLHITEIYLPWWYGPIIFEKSIKIVERIKRNMIGSQFSSSLLFLTLEGEIAFQYGNRRMEGPGIDNKIDAMMNVWNMHIDLSMLPFISKLSIGKEYFSGDDTSSVDLEGFANPWGERHKYHGYIDMFMLFNNNYQPGLDEWNVKAEFSLPSGFMLNVHYHDFKDGIKSEPLGTELDIVFSKKLGFGGVLQQGFSRYWEQGGDQLDYGWFMLTFTL